jgi:hypothetical protein
MGNDDPAVVSRRQSLVTMAAGATAGLAGCGSTQDTGGVGDSFATDVIVHNAASAARTVSVRITAVDADTPHTDTTLALSSGETVDPVNDGKLPATDGGYVVDVDVDGGPSETFEWTDLSADLAPLWVRVDDSENIRFLLQAG